MIYTHFLSPPNVFPRSMRHNWISQTIYSAKKSRIYLRSNMPRRIPDRTRTEAPPQNCSYPGMTSVASGDPVWGIPANVRAQVYSRFLGVISCLWYPVVSHTSGEHIGRWQKVFVSHKKTLRVTKLLEFRFIDDFSMDLAPGGAPVWLLGLLGVQFGAARGMFEPKYILDFSEL